jgi:hypothetical protein
VNLATKKQEAPLVASFGKTSGKVFEVIFRVIAGKN